MRHNESETFSTCSCANIVIITNRGSFILTREQKRPLHHLPYFKSRAICYTYETVKPCDVK